MGEVFWSEPNQPLSLPKDTVYAQTFSPLWSHTVNDIRVFIKYVDYPTSIKVAIQYLKPDGTPTGVDLTSYTFYWEHIPYGWYTNVRQRSVPPIRLIKGINYAFLIWRVSGSMTIHSHTLYQPPPSGYARGKLIKSTDGGTTWDTTDLGDMLFGEFGDPPRAPSIYDPPLDHYAIITTTQRNYRSNACFRVSTTEPATLRCLVSEEEPTRIELPRIRRGMAIVCLDHYVFKNYRVYEQLEKDDSMYHTFFLTRLKKDEKYWLAFQAEVNFETATSQGPIFERTHPEAPSFTKTLRPDAPGDECTIKYGVPNPCPDHYLNIKEATPDGDASNVNSLWSTTTPYYRDLYKIPDLPPDDLPIKQVHLTIRIRRQGGYGYIHLARFAIKTNSTLWYSDSWGGIPTEYTNYHLHLYNNPVTGMPWTPAEVNSLQIGLGIRAYWGVGWMSYCLCTQLYCKMIHDCSKYQ